MISDELFAQFKKKVEQNGERYIKDYQKIKEIVDQSSAIYEGEPVSFLYQPVFYRQQDIEELKEIAGGMVDILKKVIARYQNDPVFRDYFKFPELMEELILVDPGYDREFPMARFDIFYGPRQAKFCELNADGTSGMNEARVIQMCFHDSEVMKDFAEEYVYQTYELFYSWIDALEENFRQFSGSEKAVENTNLAIVDFSGEGVESEFEEFRQRFEKSGYNTFICDPRELEYKEHSLFYKQQKIDVIYRRATTSRLIERADEIQDLLNAYREGAVCVVGGFVSQIIHNKIIFAILHDQQKVDFLTPEEQQFIAKHVPYTAVFKYSDSELRQKVLDNKDNYILKPQDWYACHGVYAGPDYTLSEWKEIIEEIKGQEYIVQEFCCPPQRKMLTIENGEYCFEDYNVLTGVYLYNHEFNGIYNRAGRENIIGSVVESFTLPAFLIQ
ncbi:MAG: circularly permuted type 2 ATP-grasp protein, partial [Halanaerobiaceae bacterium]